MHHERLAHLRVQTRLYDVKPTIPRAASLSTVPSMSTRNTREKVHTEEDENVRLTLDLLVLLRVRHPVSGRILIPKRIQLVHPPSGRISSIYS